MPLRPVQMLLLVAFLCAEENDNNSDFDGPSPSSKGKTRKRRHQTSSEDAEEEQSDSPWKKTAARRPGCSVSGCRNPIAGCSDLAKLGVCWYHGENQTRDEGDSLAPRRNPGRAGRAPKMLVPSQTEMISLSDIAKRTTCSQEGCTNLAPRGGVCIKLAGSVFTKGAAMKDAITLSYKEVSALVMEQREELAVMEEH